MSALETKARAAGAYWTAGELMSTVFPEPRWAVPGLIAEGLNLLVGSPKLGKSWMCLGLAIAVASGGKALGQIDVEQGAVLYAALEDPGLRLQKRMRIVLNGSRVPDDLHLVTSLPRGAHAVELLSEWLDTHPDARLVIIDVLRKVVPRSDGRNMYETDYESMGALKALADQHGVAVIAVHHTRKSIDESDVFNEVSGSTGLTGAADAILVAKRSRNTAEAVLHVTGRDIAEHDYGLRFQPDICSWEILDQPAAITSMGDTRRKILAWVTPGDRHGDTPSQISAGTGIALTTVKQTVRRMTEDNQLESDGRGGYFPSVSLSPVSPVSPDPGDGDSGDSGDSRVLSLFGEQP